MKWDPANNIPIRWTPWTKLTDGDTIRVYYRAEPPTPPPTTPPPTTTTPQSTPASTALDATIAQLKALLEKAAGLQKVADDAAAAAQAAITEAKAAAARAEYDAQTIAEQYVQQIRKVLEDAGLK